jgi:S-adenosylmethionine hydrolase
LIFNFTINYIRGVNLVTFTSDFGLSDPYVGEVKGVIDAVSPETRVIDITHDVKPGNVLQASFLLTGAYRFFADGALHLVVVDPGVGTGRDIIIVQTGRYTFIGPDNGVLSAAVREDGVEVVFSLDADRLYGELRSRFYGNGVVSRLLERGTSTTFHGRDLFAPLAAYLGLGFPVSNVGRPRDGMVELKLPEPVVDEGGVAGRVVYIDHYGNIVTNIHSRYLGSGGEVYIKIKGEMVPVGGMVRTYDDVPAGRPAALVSSRERLEIAVNGGNAAEHFGALENDEILVKRKESR